MPVVLVPLLPHAQKHLLYRLVGFLLAEHIGREPVDGVDVAVVKLREGIKVSPEQASSKIFVRGFNHLDPTILATVGKPPIPFG